MNGVHDVGGMHGFGPVERHRDSLRFEHDWEPAAAALGFVYSAANVDRFRHAIERMDPVHYLGSTYFEHWLACAETLALEDGVITSAELDARIQLVRRDPEAAFVAPPTPGAAAERLRGERFRRPLAEPPRFAVGTPVRTRNIQPAGHTRLARYARDKRGVVTAHHGAFVFADTNAHELGQDPQHLYSVRFEARELWGEDAADRDAVYIDLYERYLTQETD